MNRPRALWIAAAAIGFVASAGGVARAEVPDSDRRFFVRLSPGAVYLHESWTPSGSSPGAVFSGAGTSLELSVGKSVRPRLVVGGLWQLVAVFDPTESYLGGTYVAPETFRFLNVVAALADYYPNPRRGLHVGGSAGVVVASNVDRECCLSNHLGPVLSVRVGYDVSVSRRWSVGVLAQLEGYRYWSSDANVSSASNVLLPTLALAITFDWRSTRSTGH